MKQYTASICSVCSLNYLAQTLTMIDSLRVQNDSYLFHVFLSDVTRKEAGDFKLFNKNVVYYFIDEFADNQILNNALFLSALEFNTSLKALALRRVLDEYDMKTLYCESDLFFVNDLGYALDQLDNFDILLTPHSFAFIDDESDFSMVRVGAYNAGFIAINGREGAKFVRWWEKKLLSYCFLEPEQGLFVDQKWLDLVPVLFDRVLLLKDPGYNVAYWNMSLPRDNQAIVFFHLSGTNPEIDLHSGDFLSKYSKFKIDANLERILQPYFLMYKLNSKLINSLCTVVNPTLIGAYMKEKEEVIEKRYFARNFKLRFKNGELFLSKRVNKKYIPYLDLYRTNSRVTYFSRIIGCLFVFFKLAWVLEKLLSLFRLLSRRSNWLF